MGIYHVAAATVWPLRKCRRSQHWPNRAKRLHLSGHSFHCRNAHAFGFGEGEGKRLVPQQVYSADQPGHADRPAVYDRGDVQS